MKKLIVFVVAAGLLIGGYIGVTLIAEKKAEDFLDSKIKSSKLNVKYEKVSINLAGSKAVVHGVNYEGLKAEKVVLNDIYSLDRDSKIPSKMSFSVEGLVLEQGKKSVFKELRKYGYKDDIKVNLGIDYLYTKDKSNFTVKKADVKIPDMFDASLTFDLENVNLNLNNPGSMVQILFLYPTYKLSSLKFNYRDDSLIKRFLENDAKRKGITYEKMLENMSNTIERKTAFVKDEKVKSFYNGIRKFFLNPEEYSIRAEPEKPVSLKEILKARNPEVMIRKLNLVFE